MQARLEAVIFGAYDPKAGVLRKPDGPAGDVPLRGIGRVRGGLLEDECA